MNSKDPTVTALPSSTVTATAGLHHYEGLNLSDPYFLQASRLIPFEQKAVGALVRDLFRLAPDLLRYPFESDEWNQRLGVPPQVEIDFGGEA